MTVFIEKVGHLGLISCLVIVLDIGRYADLRRRCILTQRDAGWDRVDIVTSNNFNYFVRTLRGKLRSYLGLTLLLLSN